MAPPMAPAPTDFSVRGWPVISSIAAVPAPPTTAPATVPPSTPPPSMGPKAPMASGATQAKAIAAMVEPYF